MKKASANKKKLSKRQKRQLALLTVVVLIASIIAIMFLTPGFNINNIEVIGATSLDENVIIKASGLTTGVNIFSADLGDAEDNIKAMGSIESVEVERSLPSTVVITIKEEVGVAYIPAENGYIIITADGRCIEKKDFAAESQDGGNNVVSGPKLPKITGINNIKYSKGKTITADNDGGRLEALFACLHEFARQGYISNMVEIDAGDINDIKFYYQSKALCVSMGRYNSEKIKYRMECFGEIYNYVVENTGDGEMPSGYVNLERLIYREKENPDEGEEAGEVEITP